MAAKKTVSKNIATKAQKASATRTRSSRPFPAASFEEALGFASKVLEFGSGQPVRRLSLFDHLGKSPDSGGSRQLVTNANKYGLTTGSYTSEQLQLTSEGRIAANPEVNRRDRIRVWIKLAITEIAPFKALFDQFVGNKLPVRAALLDAAKANRVAANLAEEAVDTFVSNLRFVGLLQTLSGADRIVTEDHLIEGLPSQSQSLPQNGGREDDGVGGVAVHEDADSICFFIAPIGEEASEERQHSDMVLSSLVEPALAPLGLKVLRADAIGKPGVIGKQILDALLRAKLVVADLSYHSPNVFYELAVRHVARRPTVQIIRQQDHIPFDLQQFRTVRVDTSSLFAFVPRIDAYRAEIATHARSAMSDPDFADNPISMFFPSLKAIFD